MAAQENQGLQIALIIFVVLTIMLSVATFMFFSKWDEERNKIAEYEKATKAARTEADTYSSDAKEVKAILGFGPSDTLPTIQAEKKKDFDTLAPGSGSDKQTYRELAKELKDTLTKTEGNLIAAQDREKKLGDKIKTDETTKVVEIKEYKTTVDKTSADYNKERGELKEDVNKAASTKTDAEQKFAAKRKEFDETSKKLTSQIEERDREIVKLTNVIERLTAERRQGEIDIEVADAQIRWVNQGEKLVWLNRGSADGLRQQVSFKVIARDEPNPATAPGKATVEVIRITDAHAAEARIVSDNPTDPIMPGDILFSTSWQPGRIEHFALAGFMDIDLDGESDREIVKQLVLSNGGIIDAEIADNGKLTGEMGVGTKYLIMGEEPKDKNLTPEMTKSRTRLIKQANDLGIKLMSLSKFLDYIGYSPEQKTVALDRNAKGSDFKAKLPEVPRKSQGKPIDFTPIRPKQKPTTY